jgi:DNA-binding response OmpR family regulator
VVTFNTENTCLQQLRKESSWRVVNSNVQKAPNLLSKKYVDLICIETDKVYQKTLALLKDVKNRHIEVKTLAIIPNRKKVKRIYLSYGCDDYLCIPYKCEDLLLRVKKLINHLPVNYKLIYQNNYLKYECKFNRIMYKNTYIPLTPTEILIVKLLIQNSVVTKKEIQKYLKAKLQKEYSADYLTVLIHRAKKKIKLCTGREVIKNKYGCGYYIR